jgi:hypothetical protein
MRRRLTPVTTLISLHGLIHMLDWWINVVPHFEWQ